MALPLNVRRSGLAAELAVIQVLLTPPVLRAVVSLIPVAGGDRLGGRLRRQRLGTGAAVICGGHGQTLPADPARYGG